ncbi:MAG TPA: SURF1 family protein, partial [Burkholderiaceae bacterium]|nr:SURF1 family protein [Burkholderiaceae bacterium]
MRLVVPTLAAIAVIALTVSLGNWQLRRAAEKLDAQRERAAALVEPPIELGREPLDAADLDGRRVAVEGRLVPERSIYIDNRTRRGIAGVHVVTPVRIEGTDKHVHAGDPAPRRAARGRARS